MSTFSIAPLQGGWGVMRHDNRGHQAGNAHIGPTYAVTCTRCESLLQFQRADFVQPVDRNDNEVGHIDWPVCRGRIFIEALQLPSLVVTPPPAQQEECKKLGDSAEKVPQFLTEQDLQREVQAEGQRALMLRRLAGR